MMKNKSKYKAFYYCFLTIILFYINGLCQDAYTTTPRHHLLVELYDHSHWQMTHDESLYYDSVSNWYCDHCGATIMDGATNAYNCHEFAWYKSESEYTYWMNTPEDEKYWCTSGCSQASGDTSYLQEDNATKGEKIAYLYDDHSAIETTVDDVFISKWAAGHLMKHERTCCPYVYSQHDQVRYNSRWIRDISNMTYNNGDDIKKASHGTFTVGNNVVVNAGAKVRFVSHGCLTINSGFTVQNGAQFTAETW